MIVKNTAVACDHCGLPVPAGMAEYGHENQFCCAGCSSAYQLIHGCGLEAFYRMADTTQGQPSLRARSPEPESRFDEFDDATLLGKFVHDRDDGALETTLSLDGIHCAACVWLLEKLPRVVEGVIDAKVSWTRRTVRVVWQPGLVPLSKIATTLHRLGYTPHLIRENDASIRRKLENRQHLTRIGIAAAAAGNNMLITGALYLGMFSHMSHGIETLLRLASCLIGMVSLLGPGRVFIRGALVALRTLTPHMDLPIALGLSVGTAAGLVNTVRGTGDIYFDSLSVLIFLLLVGRWIQFRQQNVAADAIDLLHQLTPSRARKIVDGKVIEIAVDNICVGDHLEIPPGELAAVDAFMTGGRSAFDESLLTGESSPAKKQTGDPILAGTKNVGGVAMVQATAVGKETRIGRIARLVEDAANDKPQIVLWANRIGGYFVAIVIGLAMATFVSWFQYDSATAIDRSIALLIVACPCALALATPLAISVAMGRLAKQKIMVKAGDVIQSLDRPGMIWLDKTGTLTQGQMQVLQWHGDSRWLPLVESLESQFAHPVAFALREFAKSRIKTEEALESETYDAKSVAGGVVAIVAGQEVAMGTRRMLEDRHIRIPGRWTQKENRILDSVQSPCWIAVDQEVVGLAALGDRLHRDANRVVRQLKHRGWTVGILSGDHPLIVNHVAEQLGIEIVHAAVTPEEKLNLIRDSVDRFETTVMVGDGTNDSVALAAATVGIAVHNSAEACLAAAPVYLADAGLKPINELIRASHATCNTIRCNLVASLGYNAVGVVLAMAGWISPLTAAVLMPLSSLTVIGISLRRGKRASSS